MASPWRVAQRAIVCSPGQRLVLAATGGVLFLKSLQLLDESRAFEIQQARGLPFISTGAFERALNQLALDMGHEGDEIDAVLGERDRRRHRRRVDADELRRQVSDIDLRSAHTERHGALYGVLELPHVTGPVI